MNMRNRLNHRIGIEEVKTIVNELNTPEEVISFGAFIHDEEPKIAWNAAWVMTHFTDEQIALLEGKRDELIDAILQTKQTPLRRLLLNVIGRMPVKESNIRIDFLDFCLEHMVSLVEPPGVQALCMKEAHRQCAFFKELQQEFQTIVSGMEEEYYSKGVICLIKKMKK